MSVSRTSTRHVAFLSLFLVFLLFLSTEAQADMHDPSWKWAVVENNSGKPGIVASQLSVDVTAYSYGTPNQVLFTFSNSGPEDFSITEIYFDDGALFGMTGDFITDPGDNVVFDRFEVEMSGPNPQPNLPGAKNVNPPFETSVGFFAAGSSGSPSGIGAGESLGIVFDLLGGMSLTNVTNAINVGFDPGTYYGGGAYDGWQAPSLRIGIHVQSIDGGPWGDDKSDTYILTPVPGAFLLGFIGLGVAGVKLRKFA